MNQISAFRPTSRSGFYFWRASLEQLTSAVESFPDVFPDTEVAYGHFRAVMAATHDGPESRAGAHEGVIVLRPPGLINPIVERPWHRGLQARLAELPRRCTVRCPAGSRTALNDLETTSESTSSDTLPVSRRVQAFHGVTEK
jgi:hypothetical protein